MQMFLNELSSQLRVADVMDIGIVSVLLYVAISWLKERASRSLALSIIALLALFLLARWLEMYLTTMIFQIGFLGVVLVLVVVFQQDIRHGFERLAASFWLRRTGVPEPTQQLVDTIAEAIDYLAKHHIGALFVFPGEEPIDRHVQGGVRVDAEISLPLLLSIFHPQTPGHDGAVLIDNQRISHLGLHLPLSANPRLVRGGGTRHAAALGLAECCDALIVAVSEERGTITFARDRNLMVVGELELAEQMRRHLEAHSAFDKRAARPWFKRLATKGVSFMLAIMLWFMFAYHTETLQRTLVVPIEYRNLPDGWGVSEPKATLAEITLAGSEQAFSMLDASKVRVSLEVAHVQLGASVQLQTEPNLRNVPSELRVNQVIPRVVEVSVHKNLDKPESN